MTTRSPVRGTIRAAVATRLCRPGRRAPKRSTACLTADSDTDTAGRFQFASLRGSHRRREDARCAQTCPRSMEGGSVDELLDVTVECPSGQLVSYVGCWLCCGAKGIWWRTRATGRAQHRRAVLPPRPGSTPRPWSDRLPFPRGTRADPQAVASLLRDRLLPASSRPFPTATAIAPLIMTAKTPNIGTSSVAVSGSRARIRSVS
jgi:hypothetical protein